MTREEAYEQLYASHYWVQINDAHHYLVRNLDQAVIRKVRLAVGFVWVVDEPNPFWLNNTSDGFLEYATASAAKHAVESGMVDVIVQRASKWTEAAMPPAYIKLEGKHQDYETGEEVQPSQDHCEPSPSYIYQIVMGTTIALVCLLSFLIGRWSV